MIKIKLINTKEETGLDFSGHANYASNGPDIVCAGVSALFWTLVYAFKKSNMKISIDGGRVTVSPKSRNAKIITDTILAGLEGIQRAFPGFVLITTEEGTPQRVCNTNTSPLIKKAVEEALQLFSSGADSAALAKRHSGENSPQDPSKETKKEEKKEKEEKEVFKLFNTKEEYQEHIDGIIGRRLKELRELKERTEKLGSVVEKLMEVFGAKNEEEFLETIIPAIESIKKNEAEKQRLADFKQELCQELETLPENIRNALDISRLPEDEDFIALIASGLSASEAAQIMCDAKAELEKDSYDEKENTQSPRPSEGALSASGIAKLGKSAEHLTNEELEEIVRRVAKGEKIKF